MINLNNLEITKQNIVVIVIFILTLIGILAGIGFLFSSLSESPETYAIEDSIDIFENDTHVELTLDSEVPEENMVISVDGDTMNWDSNKVVFEKSELMDDIQIDSYSDGSVYESEIYNHRAENVNIESDEDLYIRGVDYMFELDAQSAEQVDFENMIWYLDDDSVQRDTPSIQRTFDETGEKEISAELMIDNVSYETTKDLIIAEPDEIVLNTSVNNQNTSILSEINFQVEELSNESVESFRWDFDDGTVRTGEDILYWYQEPGEYNVSVTGESSVTGDTKTEYMEVNISELDEDEETNRLNVNVFDGHNNTRIDTSNVTINDIQTERITEDDDYASFDVIEGTYTIVVEKEGYKVYEEDVYVNDTKSIDVRLSQLGSGEVDDSEDEEIEDEEDLLDDPEDGSEIEFDQSPPSNTDNIEEPEGLDRILSETDGDGTEENPHIITNIIELKSIESSPSDYYELGNDINAAQTQLWYPVNERENEFLGRVNDSNYNTDYFPIQSNSEEIIINDDELSGELYDINYNTGELVLSDDVKEEYQNQSNVYINYEPDEVYNGFEPIDSMGVSPVLDGNDYHISNLHINRPNENNVGIFNEIDGGSISNVVINGITVSGNNNVGGIIGTFNRGLIDNVNVGGQIIGNDNVGGSVGHISGTTVLESQSIIDVDGQTNVGGFAGYSNSETELNKVSARTNDNSYIQGNENIGGLIGNADSVSINNAYSINHLHGNENIGGLIGSMSADAEISNSYVISEIEEQEEYDTFGNIVGLFEGNLNNIYWNAEKSEFNNVIGEDSEENIDVDENNIIGLEEDEMQRTRVFANMELLDFDDIWNPTFTYPTFIEDEVEEEELIDELNNIKIENSVTGDEITTGTVTSNTPEYINEFPHSITVNIYESGVEKHSFSLEEDITESPDYDPEEDGPVEFSKVPDVPNHPNYDSIRFEGYRYDSAENELDVVFTAIEDDEDVIYDREQFIVEVQNEEDIQPTITVNDEEKTGRLTQFELITDRTYDVTVDADRYDKQEFTIDMGDERKINQPTLMPSNEYDIQISSDVDSDIGVDSEIVENTRDATFTDLLEGDYFVQVQPISGDYVPIREIVEIRDEDYEDGDILEFEYNLNEPLLTVHVNEVEDEDVDPYDVESNFTLTNMDTGEEHIRSFSESTHFDSLEEGTYELELSSVLDEYVETTREIEFEGEDKTTDIIVDPVED